MKISALKRVQIISFQFDFQSKCHLDSTSRAVWSHFMFCFGISFIFYLHSTLHGTHWGSNLTLRARQAALVLLLLCLFLVNAAHVKLMKAVWLNAIGSIYQIRFHRYRRIANDKFPTVGLIMYLSKKSYIPILDN